jgi:hypothetical protein
MTLEHKFVTYSKSTLFAGDLLVLLLLVENLRDPILLKFRQMQVQVRTDPINS